MKIIQQQCTDDLQANVMANAMQKAGAEVFSIHESEEGRWHVWAKIPDDSVSDRINVHFNRDWREFQQKLPTAKPKGPTTR